MKEENKNPLVIAIYVLAVSILLSSGFLGHAIMRNGEFVGTGVSNGMNSAANAISNSNYVVNDTDIMTLLEAADYLKLSQGDLSVLAQQAVIPCYQINGETMFSKTALSAWIKDSADGHASY